MKTFAAVLALLACASAAAAQEDDAAALKRRILTKVAERLAAERAALLQRIEKIIDEELSRPAPAAGDDRVRELERKQRALEEERERVAEELARAKRETGDQAVREEAKKQGPHDLQEAQELFDTALQLHEAKDFKESVRLFKRIHFQFPKHQIGFTSAYNVACGYALAGDKDRALDWLETSVKSGFSKIDHLRSDPDLDTLRDEKRYKRLLADR